MSALTRDAAANVASSFLTHYYNEFVKVNEMVSMAEMYADNSSVMLADLGEDVPMLAQGKRDITLHLAKTDNVLGQRKVEIITADSIPLPNGWVEVVCQGVMYLRAYRRVFLHAFVLAPTQYRANTFYIASDYLRFVNAEEEVIPPGALILTPDQVVIYLAEEAQRRQEELQRRELELQRRQLMEFQERIKRQNEEALAQAQAQAQAQQQRQQQQQQQSSASKMAIPAPASKQGRPPHTSTPPAGSTPAPQHPAPASRDPRDRYDRGGDDHRPPRGERRDRDDRRPPREERRVGGGERDREDRRPPREDRRDDRRVGGGDEPRDRREDRRGRGDRKPREEAPAKEGAQGSAAPATKEGGASAENGASSHPRGERPPRRERPPRGGAAAAPREERGPAKEEGNGEGKPSAAEARPRRERRERKPRDGKDGEGDKPAEGAEGKAARPPREPRKAPARSGPTSFARLPSVPKTVALTDLRSAIAKAVGEEPKDARWFGRDNEHVVVEFASEEAAERFYKRASLQLLDKAMRVVAFYP